MSKPPPARYRTRNWSSSDGALRKRGSVLIQVDQDMVWLAPHEGGLGRPPIFSDAAIPFCLSIRVPFKLPLRQAAGMVASLAEAGGVERAHPRLQHPVPAARNAGRPVPVSPCRWTHSPCSWTAPASRSSVMANGRPASTGPKAAAGGVRGERGRHVSGVTSATMPI